MRTEYGIKIYKLKRREYNKDGRLQNTDSYRIELCSKPQGFRVHFQSNYFAFKWSILDFLYIANCNLILLFMITMDASIC